MNGLRWVLGIVTVLFGAGWAMLLILSEKFRESFGASSIGPVTALLPFPVVALMLVSLRAGSGRMLMHVTAAVVIGAMALVVWSAEGKMDPSVVAPLLCLALWLVYYGLSL